MSTGAFLEFLTRLGCRDAGLGLVGQVCRKGLGRPIKTRACGPGLQGAWGPGPPGLGARPTRGLGPFPHKNHQTSQITIFRKPPGGSLAKAWVSAETAASEVGTWRETKPGYPPYPPPPPFGRKEEGFHPLRLRQPSNTPPKVGGYVYVYIYIYRNIAMNTLSPAMQASNVPAHAFSPCFGLGALVIPSCQLEGD